jgi:outer membrane receptor protein involved in Fe transport
MRPLFTTRIAWSAVLLALAAAPAIAQLPSADSAAEFKLAATWTPARTSTVAPLRRAIALNLEGASVKQALREIGRLSGIHIAYGDDVLHSDARVSVHADGMTVREALAAVLEGSGLDAFVSLSGKAVLVRAIAVGDSTQGGTVTGRVTDAKTGHAIPGASVVLERTRWRATAGEDGAYRLADVAVGTYTLTASRIGYAKQRQAVTVAAGQEATVDMRLELSASPLDAVVVTGTMVPTEVKALPTPVTVIIGDQIEQRGYQRVDQVFRGDVPGAIAWDQSAGRDHYSTIDVRGASTLTGLPGIKTFIDGVEVADQSFIAMINPNSIDRVEITRGPQASTLYGAGALDGVMQIFTKKGQLGLTRPEVNGKVSAGGIGGFDGRNAAPEIDNAVSVIGGSENTSYNLGGSYRHIGEWVPSYQSTDWSASVGAQTTQGPLTLSTSARYAAKTFDAPFDTRLQAYTPFSKPSYQTQGLQQQTYGLTARLQTADNWEHVVTLGYDQTSGDYHQTQARFTTPADSFLTASLNQQAKVSLLYHTDVNLQLWRAAAATVMTGVNYESYHGVNSGVFNATRTTGVLDGFSFIVRSPWSNTGLFSQVQFDFAERLFVTGGLRAEWSQNFGAGFGTAWSPRVGASYVLGVGRDAVKVRASYGESIRAPSPGLRSAQINPRYIILANPDLAPERQHGVDGGIDVYLGQASLGITYYNQRVIDLIDFVTVPNPPGDTLPTFQYQNISRVKNEGWEFEGHLPLGRVNVSGTYSITNSTVQKLPSGYTGQYQIGDQILSAPRNSAGARVTYSPLPHTTLTASMTHIGHWTNTDLVALYGRFFGGQPYRGSSRAYWLEYPTVTKFTVGASQAVTKGVTAFVRAENIGNSLRYEELNFGFIPTPRTVIVGANLRY